MMKRVFLLMLTLLLLCSAASATILPPAGVDEGFRELTGIGCTPAVVLCQSLSVYDERGDQNGKKVTSLRYSGEAIPVIESWDGWAKIYYEDGTKTGWVHSEYLLFDPAWYVCDEGMAVYAYPDTMAPRVGWLAAGTTLPIVTESDQGALNGWVCVSLRGAAGWIRKTPADTVDETSFRPEMLAGYTFAELSFPYTTGSMCYFDDEERHAALEAMLINAEDMGGEVAGCPFGAVLYLELADGSEVELQIATDSCCVYRVDGRDYQYARNLWSPEGSPDNSVLFSLFDTNAQDTWADEWDGYSGNG